MEQRVLVVDDEKSISDAITYALKREGVVVDVAYNGEEALEKIKSFQPIVVVLDVMMPVMNGYEVLKKYIDTQSMGFILMTAKNDIVDKVLGLELGADDYITKPFDMRELLARIKSLLRRLEKIAKESESEQQNNGIYINKSQRKVLVDGVSIDLTPKEFELLALLFTRLERVYTRDELLDMVWGIDYFGGTRTVDIHIQRIRKKMGEKYENALQTVHGVGYKAIKLSYED